MKTSGIFTTHEYRIHLSKYGKDIFLYPFGDIHWNSPACDRDKFISWCKEVRNQGNAYFIGMGDYLETLSSFERRAYNNACLHDSSNKRIEDVVKQDTEDFIKQIGFMKDRTVGIVGGNHYFQFANADTTDLMISRGLNSKYLGCNSIIRLYLEYDKDHVHKIDICVHHGLGGGGHTVGSSMNKLQIMANSFDADIILQGHDHNRAVDYINRLGLTDARKGVPRLINRRILMARTGSFLRGYIENQPSYVCDMALSPTDLGVVKIILRPTRLQEKHDGERTDMRWVDIEARL